MASIGLAFLLFWITNVSFAESDPSLTLSPENKKLINDESKIAAMAIRLDAAEAKYIKKCFNEVGTNFKCAMDKMKNGFTNFLQFQGVGSIKECGCFRKWNPRVLQIRIENDLVWKTSFLMYPDSSEKAGVVAHEKDNITMCRWIKFVTLDLQVYHFNLTTHKNLRRDEDGNFIFTGLGYYERYATVCRFKVNSRALRNNLKDYYGKLDQAERDTRYPKGKRDLYRYFAGVMVRMYRLACYYAHDLQYDIQRVLRWTYENGTNFFLSTALIESMPTWYVDQEQLDMLNIVLRMQGFTKPKHFFFVSKNITNGMGQKVVIPGYKNCGSEPVTPRDELES